MNIEVGKSYRTREGNRVTVYKYEGDGADSYPFMTELNMRESCLNKYGAYWDNGESDRQDIVAEWDESAVIAPIDKPLRVEILKEGAALTHGARDAEYGPPAVNMAAAGELKQLMRRHTTRTLSPGEWEALDMMVTKLSRLLTGAPKRDTYVDMATYAAIAGEIALTSNFD